MEAKDTVMVDEQLKDLQDEGLVYPGDVIILQRDTAQVQAEISFKVGKTLGVAESLQPALKAIENSRKAGIREVVDWVDGCISTGDCFQEDGSVAYRAGDIVMTKVLWQAQLKEWGIE